VAPMSIDPLGTNLWVTCGLGLQSMDVSDPSHPKPNARVDTSKPVALAMAGGYIYMAVSTGLDIGGLQIVSTTNRVKIISLISRHLQLSGQKFSNSSPPFFGPISPENRRNHLQFSNLRQRNFPTPLLLYMES
jgi:hypothetical protein